MYLASFDRHLETLVSTSCLQVSPYVLRSVDTSLNTFLSPALPVEPSSSLAAQRPARRSCLSRSSSPLRSTSSRNNTARYTQGTPANAKPEPTSSTEPGEIRIKMEQLEALMTSAATTAVNVMLNNQSQYANTAPPPNQPFGGVRPRYQIQGQGPNAPPNRGPGPGPNQRAPCYYCHTPGCLTWRCPHVEADIQAGLIKRAVGSNRIVLPSSAEIPNDPPNASWREQVQE